MDFAPIAASRLAPSGWMHISYFAATLPTVKGYYDRYLYDLASGLPKTFDDGHGNHTKRFEEHNSKRSPIIRASLQELCHSVKNWVLAEDSWEHIA